jgi:hypothetical protein
MTNCKECTDFRPFRNLSIEGSYWRPLASMLPEEALLAMNEATLCAIHHRGSDTHDEPALLAGVRALIGYYESRDVVPREEMNGRLTRAFNDFMRERAELERTAKTDAEKRFGSGLREAQTRVANVQALVSQAHGRKTMRTEEVRAAIEWRTGEPLPEATVEHQRRLYGAETSPAPA